MKILMVCLGNICRSPLAEGIMRTLIDDHQLDWQVDSAGTGSYHVGESPDLRSVEVAKSRGLDISSQRARQFHHPDFQNFDVIYVMDSANYQDVTRQSVNQLEKDKVKLILNESKPGWNQNVPDPYWDNDGFEKVYDMLLIACENVIKNNE